MLHQAAGRRHRRLVPGRHLGLDLGQTALDAGVPLQRAHQPRADLVRVVDLRLPQVAGLSWIRRISSRTSVQVDQRRIAHQGFIVEFRIDEAGQIRIPPCTLILADGSRLSTEAKLITASEPRDLGSGAFHAEVVFIPDRIFPGQQTEMRYRLFWRADQAVQSADPGVEPPPEAILLGERGEASHQTWDRHGRQWRKRTISWPMTVGKPGSYRVHGQQTFEIGRRSGFPWRMRDTRSETIAVRPGELTVLPLPMAGRPDDFTGLVGSVSARAQLAQRRLHVGEGTVLEVRVRGAQTDLLPRPRAPELDGLRLRPLDEAQDRGEHVFRWNIEAERAGDYRIPAFSFSYFEPGAGRYDRVSTDAITLNVLPGQERSTVVAGNLRPLEEKDEPDPAAERAAAPLPLRGSGAWMPRPIHFWLVLLAAMALGLAIGGSRRLLRRRDPSRGERLRRALRGADPAEIDQALHALLPELDDETRQEAERLLNAVEQARFGGGQLDAELVRHLRELL